MSHSLGIRITWLAATACVAVLTAPALTAPAVTAPAPTADATPASARLELVVVGVDGRVRELLTDGAVLRSGADLRLRAPAGSSVSITMTPCCGAPQTFTGPAPLIPHHSLLVSAVPPGKLQISAEAHMGAAAIAKQQWQITVLGDSSVRSRAPGKPSALAASAAPAALQASLTAARGAPSLQFARQIAARRGGAEEVPRGAREAALFRQWAAGVVLVDTPTGLGSGAVINRAERLIVTNYHVVADNEVVQVAFKPQGDVAAANAQSYRAQVIKFDQVADLALLRVSELPAWVPEMKLGSLAGLEPGVDVHAIGHPTGELWSYTQGIVSQVRRNYSWHANDGGFDHVATVIQTQTPINPGNSGGPLFDDNGAIVGINSFGRAETQGLNFAVSVEQIRTLLSASGNRQAQRTAGSAEGKGGGGKESQVPPQKSGDRPGDRPGSKSGDIGGDDHKGRRNALIFVDTDGDGRIDTVFSDRKGDGHYDMRTVDENGDGIPDVWYIDEDGDGQADIVGRDLDGDGQPDVWRLING